MNRQKTLTVNWDGLGDVDEDDEFFETYNRLSAAVPQDLVSSSDEDEDFEDSRLSFSSTISAIQSNRYGAFSQIGPVTMAPVAMAPITGPNYDIWMAAPGSITERRKQLLYGMGLASNKESLKVTSDVIAHAITRKFENGGNPSPPPLPLPSSSSGEAPSVVDVAPTTPSISVEQKTQQKTEQKTEHSPVSFVLVRSRSEGDIEFFSMAKSRKEEMIGKVSKQRLTRTTSRIAVPRARMVPYTDGSRVVAKDADEAGQSNLHGTKLSAAVASSEVGAFFLIKNLDTGKEFIVNEYGENGMWNRLSDLQTGKQLTMEEFEKTVGHSSIVKELMKRAKVNNGFGKKFSSKSISKSLRLSKKRGAELLKNIKGVASGKGMASGFKGEREREETIEVHQLVMEPKSTKNDTKNDWVRVRQTGKSHKELSALHLCQDFQAHEGCIWTVKFSLDGHYLASAGEDKIIHVWEVQECELMSLKPEEGNLTPIHPSLRESPSLSSDKKKKGKVGSKRMNIPDYVHVPETVFSLPDKPYYSFNGHLDEVLDLSWSKSQLLLSSSMDKTVRLWDLETKTCLKMFAHNDYVTCIQFNPIDEDYFISGSLDAKIRIWNIPERHVVDWIDIHEMVTAVSYTPDGQAALVGTHKGNCRIYSIEDCKLTQTNIIELRHKKKSLLKKVTGFQFAPGNPSKVLVTSADCRIKIVDGSEVVQKFKGFRNANSQIAASFSSDGRYIISASEDSLVFVWKHEETRGAGTGKAKTVLVTQSHEHFQCKNVSVAIPWPCTIKGDPPPMPVPQSKKNTKRPTPSSQAPSTSADDPKKMLPPLPKKNNDNNAMESASTSTSTEEDPAAISNTGAGAGDSLGNSKRMLPPLPKKSNNQATENAEAPKEEDPEAISRMDSGVGDSFASGSASVRYGDSPSISAASATTPSFDSSNGGTPTCHSSAWGMVIVTAGIGGEIRCYQNFGLPRRMSANLFGGPT